LAQVIYSKDHTHTPIKKDSPCGITLTTFISVTMMFSMVLALTLLQSTMGAEVAGDTGDDDTFIQCLYALIRVILLSATFVLAQRALKARNGQQSHRVQGAKGSPKRFNTNGHSPKKLTKHNFASDDEDDLSTSVGSSDSESDMLSSEDEEDRKATKISVSALLQCRPAVGPAPLGSLRAMAVVERTVVSRQQFEARCWENLRSPADETTNSASKPAKTASTKQPLKSDSKLAKKTRKAPIKAVPMPIDEVTAAANSARMQALLEIICPEDVPTVEKATAKSALPPWRRQPVTAAPPGL